MARPNNGNNMPAPTNKPADLSYPEIAQEYGIDKATWQALQNLYPGAQPASIVMVYEYCKVRQLDALKKPVHIVPMYVEDKSTGQKAMRDVIMPGIQEMRITAARTREYAGIDPPVLGKMIEVPLVVGESTVSPATITVPESATVTVYRLVQGKRYAFTHTEYFLEAVARNGSGKINDMWKKRSIGQLCKCAEAGAHRKAFPEEFGGEYAAEEMIGQTDLDMVEVLPDANGASGIPGPEEAIAMPEPVSADAPAAPTMNEVDLPKTALEKQQDDATGLVDPEEAKAAEARIAAREQQAAKPAPAAPAAPTGMKVDLPPGAASVLAAQLRTRGVEQEQLLAKIGTDITTANINQALALLKNWGA